MSEVLKKLVVGIGLDPQRATTLSSGGGSLSKSTLEITPDDFLERAEEDYEQGGTSAQLNAITNAKRAVEAQVDEALLRFGYRIKRWPWEKRLKTFSQLGLVAPRILRRIRSPRNALEHEYRVPSDQEIEEAMDLASLFVAASQRHLSIFMDEFTLGNEDEQVDAFHFERELSFTMCQLPSTFSVSAKIDVSPERSRRRSTVLGEVNVDASHRTYPVLVQLAIATDRRFRLNRAVERFFSVLSLD